MLVISIGTYFGHSYFQNKAKEKETREAKEKARQSEKKTRLAAAIKMASNYGAITNWEDVLAKGSAPYQVKVFTMELENLWIIRKPLLFKGRINDISNINSKYYRINISLLPRFKTKLALNLSCPKDTIDAFLKSKPNIQSATVAVIAKINKVETFYKKIENDDVEEIKTGLGQCVEIILFSDNYARDLLESALIRPDKN